MNVVQGSVKVSDKYINIAKEILSGSLLIPAETINDDCDIRSLGQIDSLTFEIIVLEIEKATGKTIDPVDMIKLTSVVDIAELLEKANT